MESTSNERRYRILVVDDEPMIARGIQSMLKRLAHPAVDRVETAFSGERAIAAIRSEKPDIVILDIRMPGISGLDVIEQCHGAESPIFFVLSGHDEFDYVKNAFKLGALDYLLKPASLDDLSALIDTATRNIQTGWKTALADDISSRWSIQMEIEKALDTTTQVSIRDAVGGENELFEHDWFRISILRTSRSAPEDALAMRKTIGPSIWRIGTETRTKAFFFWTPESDLGVFWNTDNRDSIEPMRRLWETFPDSVCSAPGTVLAIGESVRRDADLRELYERVSTLLLYRFSPHAPRIVTVSDVRETYGVPATIDVSDTIYAARTSSLDAVQRAGEEVFADTPRGHGAPLREAYGVLLSAIDAYCERIGRPTPRALPIYELDRVAEVRKELKTLVESAISSREPAARAPLNPVEYAIEYVEEHLHENLDMATVATSVGLSYSHFSRLFKNKVGEGFGRYVLSRRMRRAKRMLDEPSMRVSEVAYAVGYRNHKHFTRAFREYFGYTPIEYREGVD